MSNPNDTFARSFFTRTENDDTIEQFKRQYMDSKKNYQMAMDSNNDTNVSNRFNERDIRSPPPKVYRNDEPSSVRNHNLANSRLSSTATLSADDHQDLSVLKDEVQKLINAREKDNLDKIGLKTALDGFDSRLNKLENIVLRSQSQSQNNSSRPQSYESYGRNPAYNYTKDEHYNNMLKEELNRHAYDNKQQYYNNNNQRSNYYNSNRMPPSSQQGYFQPPVSSQQRFAPSSLGYSPPPQQQSFLASLSGYAPPPQQNYYSDDYNNDRRRMNNRSYEYNNDANTIDLLKGRI